MPYVAYLGLTSKCNLRCKHCYVDEEQRNAEMPIEAALSLVRALRDAGFFKIVYTHGELPFYKAHLEVMREVQNLGLIQCLLTNGMTLTDWNVIEFENLGVSKAILSMDSSTPEQHCENRGSKNAWSGLMHGISLLKKKTRMSIGINTVLTPISINELKDIHDIVAAQRISEWYLLPYHGNDIDQIDFHKKSLSPLIDLIAYMRSSGSQVELFIHDPILSASLKKGGHLINSDVCGAGRDYISIHSNGDVYPCNFLSYGLGNVFRDGLGSVLKNVEEFSDNHMEYHQKCKDCAILNLCGGGCLAMRAGSNLDARCGG